MLFKKKDGIMKEARKILLLVGLLHFGFVLVSAGQAATNVFMDGTLHNGALTASSAGYWSDPSAIPAGWAQLTPTAYTAGGGTWVMITGGGTAVNNTGESVIVNQQYTIQADLGGFTGYPATVNVYATQYADGTGNKALLASLTRMGNNSVEGYSLFTVANTGSGVGSSYAGYYIQVALEGSGYYDNIIVTSDTATSMTYMNATLHNGALTASGAGNWNAGFTPAGWAEVMVGGCYQTGYQWPIIYSPWGSAVNNTGELVQAWHQFTVSASLGATAGNTARVRVYATQNIDGTGAKVLIAEVSRYETTGIPTYTLYPVTGDAGKPTTPNLEGYYVQVKLLGGQAYYDNIVVTSQEAPEPMPNVYMSGDFHNGSLTAQQTGFWSDILNAQINPLSTPAEWVETIGYMYTGYSAYEPPLMPANEYNAQSGTTAQALCNTGEMVPAYHAFKVSADLGGQAGSSAIVKVYATENIDGSGYKFPLAEVSRLSGTGEAYNLYTVEGTPGSVTPKAIEGYYVQVVIGGGGVGYYDNIVVTSVEMPAPTSAIYMDADFHNGALNSPATGGDWTDPNYIAYGWSSEGNPEWIYTASSFVLFDGHGQSLINNTGELVPANHRFTVQADLGGVTGGTAQAFVYATENADGTGNKVLLVQVNRPGNDADGYALFTVANTGILTDPSIEGYYVQVVLKTIGDEEGNGNCYYDNIVVTSAVGSVCGDAEHPYPIGDLSQDCYVDTLDIEIFAEHWLASDCAEPDWCNGADLDFESNVNLKDFAVLAEYWLDCTDPEQPCGYNP